MSKEAEEIDAARLDEDHQVMIGKHAKMKSLSISEIDLVMSDIISKRERSNQNIPEELRLAASHCRRFRSFTSETKVKEARKQLLAQHEAQDAEGNLRKVRRCHTFEAAQLINLMPRSEEEAKKLIPTLEENAYLKDLVSELQPMRDDAMNPGTAAQGPGGG
mmetsp:Transcript_30896/g.72088  ORF Transcript_30896/g.72088 Transcript_30896/m.72088 type:complete len:162 (+) Transcript_30896:59-544(+)